MSSYTTSSTGHDADTRATGTAGNRERRTLRRISTETKASVKTSELAVYVLAVIGVLVASLLVDDNPDFGAQEAWRYVTFLTIGYMISRGLAKSGSRDFYDDDSEGR